MRIHTLGSAIVLWAFATGVSAQTLPLPEQTTGLTPIQGKITEVQTVRVPVGDAITGLETRVTLQFELQGCLDRLMPLISYSEVQDDKVSFYVTALNAHSEKSKAAKCRSLPQASAQVRVSGIFQPNRIRVVFLEDGSSNTPTPAGQRPQALYVSKRFGFRVAVPSSYVLSPSKTQPSLRSAKPLEVLEIWQRSDFSNRAALPETPPIMSIAVYRNAKRLPLTSWKGELSRSDDRPLTVGGQPAIAYTSTGLYESDNVLVASPDGQYVFRLSVGYMDTKAAIRQAFQDLVASFTF